MLIKFSKKFDKHFKKIPSNVKLAFEERLTIFIENKFSLSLSNHKLHGRYSDYRSINITGD